MVGGVGVCTKELRKKERVKGRRGGTGEGWRGR